MKQDVRIWLLPALHFNQSEASYPAGQWPQSAHRQDIAQEGDWPVAPCGGATHATLERAQTATESQTRDLKPDYNNEI